MPEIDDDVRSSWEPETTGFAPHFRGVVRDASFQFNNRYKDGEVCLLELLVEPCDEDKDQFGEYLEDGCTSIWYGCGKGWEPADKGATAQHDSGRARRFAKGTNIATLMTYSQELEGLGEELMKRGRADQANVWVGLDLTFELVEFNSKSRDGDDITWTVRLPVEYHGVAGETEAKVAKKAPAKKAAPKPAADEGEDEGTTYNLPAKIRGQLKALAATAETHDDFMESAFAEYPDMGDDAETAVADEEFYLSLKAG